MTSMSNPQSPSQALNYLAKENYYQKNSEIGRWRGSEIALKQLGLKEGQEIDHETFKSVLYGYHPETGKKVAEQAGREDRRSGFDITMSSPKSVSVLIELADAKGDEKLSLLLRNAHDKATQYSMNKILDNVYAKTRILNHKKTQDAGKKITDSVKVEAIWGSFEHDTGRRTEAGDIDPQLHSHNFVMSLVFYEDPKTGDMKPRQLTNEEIYRQKMYMGQIYRNELASILQEQGLPIKLSDAKQGFFDLCLFTEEQLDAFSGRRADLEEAVKEELKKEWVDVGHYNGGKAELYNNVSAKTKTEKEKIDRDELLAINEERLEKEGIGEKFLKFVNDRILHKEIHKLGKVKNLTAEDQKRIDALREDHVAKAVNLIEETKSVFSYEDIIKDTLKLGLEYGYKENDYEKAIMENIAGDRLIKLADNVYSTTRMVDAEIGIVDHIHNTRDSQAALSDKEAIEKFVEKKGIKFKEGQDQMMEHTLATKEQFCAIQGDAGTGKSWVAQQIKMFMDENHSEMEMVGLAYTGQAAGNLEKSSKIKSTTMHSFLNQEKNREGSGEPTKPRMIVVDKTGMAGSLQIKEVMDAAIENGDRVVFMGDTKQFQSIAAGQAFADMQKYGISYVEITKAVRQTTEHAKNTVLAIKDKDYESALGALKGQNAYVELSEVDAILKLSSDYTKKYKDMDPLKDELILTSKNQTRTAINKRIHENLFADKEQQDFTIRDTISINGITRHFTHDLKNIMKAEPIVVLIPTKKIDGFEGGGALKNGAAYKLSRIIDDKRIEISTKGGKKTEINGYDIATDFNIYAEKEKSFAIGETITFTKNFKKDPYTVTVGKGKRARKEKRYETEYKNGERDVIKEVNGEFITLESGTTINTKEFSYFDYGYAVTDFKSQGATVTNVSIFADPRMANFHSLYTQATRAKENITLYTSSKEGFEASLKCELNQESTLHYTMKRINGEYRKRHVKVSENMAKKEYVKPLTYSGKKFEETEKILEKGMKTIKKPIKTQSSSVAERVKAELAERLKALTAKVKELTVALGARKSATKGIQEAAKKQQEKTKKINKTQDEPLKVKEEQKVINIPSVLEDEKDVQQPKVERQHTR